MAFIYAAFGIFLVVFDTPYLMLPDTYKNILGSAMIAYAAFRAFRVFQNFNSSDREVENEDQNK